MKLSKMKVVEMRKELEDRNLDSTGTRPTLMKRLRAALEKEQSAKPEQEASNQTGAAEATKLKANADEAHQDPSLDESNAASEQLNTSEVKSLPSAGNEVQVSSQVPPSIDRSAEAEQAEKDAVGSTVDNSTETSMEERLKKRQGRFGTINTAPQTMDEAIQRRRKRFGVVQKDSEERPAKRRNSNKQVDIKAVKELEEAKKRRALKFGIPHKTATEPITKAVVSADEMEKRLRRQRRFQ